MNEVRFPKGKIHRLSGLVLLFITLAGFFYVVLEKQGALISETTDEASVIEYSQVLEGNHSYEIEIGASQSTIYTDALVRAIYVIYIDDVEVIIDSLQAWDTVGIGESNNGEAYDSNTHFLTSSTDVNLTIVGAMTSGDYWSIKIYQDVPPIEIHLVIIGVTMLFSIVVILRGAYMENDARNYAKGRTDAQRSETYHS